MENQMKDNAGAPSVESLLKRGCLFLEDSEWNKADEYFDKALDINPEHAPAYIGKLCVELMARREDSLGDYNELRQGKKIDRTLGEYANFKKALRFADDGYKKKLNDFDQKIKDSFPKIPQRFTDEFIKSEIAKLEKEIANCDTEIAKAKEEEKDATIGESFARENKQKLIDGAIRMGAIDGDYQGATERIQSDSVYQSHDKSEKTYNKRVKDAQQRVNEYTRNKAGYEAKKQELEQLADISSHDRMDYHYNRFVEAMKKESTEEEYKNFAQQFRFLEGYKDSVELTGKCDKLADECVKKKEREKKARYDALVREKTNASSEDKYKQLAQQFREMGNYENAVQLANECDKQFNVLKGRREEQERQECERRKEQERQEQARIWAEREVRIRSEAEAERKKKLKKNIGLLLQFGMLFAYLCLLWGTNLIYSIWGTNLIYSISDRIFLILLIPAVLSLALGIISWLFRKDANPKLPWGTVFLILGMAATTVTGSVWEGEGIAGAVILVILALIPIFFAYKFGTISPVVATVIVGGIITSISKNSSIITFLVLLIPAIPGMIIMDKTEDANW